MGLRALDMFCGMGGLSWGLQATGFINPVWAVDKHPPALKIYQNNFPSTHILNLDLSKPAQARELVEKIQFHGGIDVVVGGSPCRGFTQIRNGQDITTDPHNRLAIKFAETVRQLEPMMFLYENVPQLATFDIFPRFLSRLRGRGIYQVAYAVVEAANFGTPSRRTRLFVAGFRRDLGQMPVIAKGLDVPYQQFWWHRHINDGKASYSLNLQEPWRSHLLDPYNISLVNVEQALSDLPILDAGETAGRLAYATAPQSAYQKWARQGSRKPDGHVVPRIRPETKERLRAIEPGGNWRDLPEPLMYKIPHDPTSGQLKRRHYSAYRRLLPEGLSPTVQGHSDFAFHYKYERVLTPRELARLMGFPDRFKLGQCYNSVVHAIGNAVPPLVATNIANALLQQAGYLSQSECVIN
ncbi:DNA cytosine methyltransferase [Leptolyngbya sp. FACHB-16]|uniref:DNA cytosine methyltransferase n=1 Tax=unclassified Leptolyngbya TaxID=2650499 RepID=UPI001689D128|nr:DNA cytosine methyltransferase [Leptolyngbya sp. FACHB-16]MBD2153092.1 DNA cytosine methyltransferase [Leptolyngbya sp. FACHB-16]